jgi:hypothetical protein
MSISYNNRRSRGLCGACGKIRTSKANCKSCLKKRRDRRSKLGKCISCSRKAIKDKRSCQFHLDQKNEQVKSRHRKNRDIVFIELGSKCMCCNETEPLFLTVDHINNDGAKHRRKIGKSGQAIYAWLIKYGIDKSRFQLLCFNCNSGRARNNGICPHQT